MRLIGRIASGTCHYSEVLGGFGPFCYGCVHVLSFQWHSTTMKIAAFDVSDRPHDMTFVIMSSLGDANRMAVVNENEMQ